MDTDIQLKAMNALIHMHTAIKNVDYIHRPVPRSQILWKGFICSFWIYLSGLCGTRDDHCSYLFCLR
ncbi:MAG: hypothetical protein ACLQBQ_11300 [Smithella sp.]